MGKTRKLHIGNSFFKVIRNWFGKKTRTIFPCFFSKVEQDERVTADQKDSGSVETAKALPKSRTKSSLDLKHVLLQSVRSSESVLPCGIGSHVSGEHPLVPSSSDHASPPETSDLSPRASSSCPNLNQQPRDVRGSPDHRHSVLGSFSQADVPRRARSILDGTQCTSISFTALIMNAILPVGLWTSETVDRVVRLGDRLHQHVIGKLGSKAPSSFYLAADEMPRRPEDRRCVWPVSCTKGKEFVGVVYPGNKEWDGVKTQLTWQLGEGCPFRDLGNSLVRCIQGKTHGCILTTECRSSAVLKNRFGEYLVVDSHARDALGVTCPDGKATVLRFASVRDVVTYFKNKSTGVSLYNLSGFEIDLELQNANTPDKSK